MIRLEVIENFRLKEFSKLKKLERKGKEEAGKLFVGDTFECDEQLQKYLLGDNPIGRAVVKVIKIVPEKEEITEEKLPTDQTGEEITKVEEKPKKKKRK